MKMCQAFAANGHSVTLSALAGFGGAEEAFRYYGVERRFELIRHNEQGHAVIGKLWALRSCFPRLRVGSVPSILFGKLAIAPLVRGVQPDLVYARNIAWLVGLPTNVAFVAETHVPPSNRLESAIQLQLYRRPGFRRLVVISHRLKDIYVSLWPWLSKNILVAHDAADDPRPETWVRPNQAGFHVGFVGHLYAGRGFGLIVDIAKALPDVTFHVVGATDYDREHLIEHDLPKNLMVHPYQPPSRLGQFFTRFDAVLAPYQQKVAVAGGRGDIAAVMSPLKLFEYMSWGKPILCSDLPVLREVIEDGRNGILLPPDDVAAWAQALQRLVREPAECRRLSTNARSDFLTLHTWKQRAAKVISGLT